MAFSPSLDELERIRGQSLSLRAETDAPPSFAGIEKTAHGAWFLCQGFERSPFALRRDDPIPPKVIDAAGERWLRLRDRSDFGDRFAAMGDRHHIALPDAAEQFAEGAFASYVE